MSASLKIETLSEQRCFGGIQGVYRHVSAETGTAMRFGVFTPPEAESGRVPLVWFLSGLTCTEENFITKAGAQRAAAELGLMLVVPDTSPRGEGVPGDPEGAYDFGLGAGFYIDATELPWSKNYRMYSYLARELPATIAANFPADMGRQGISGHSMGGHGALTLALKNPKRFRSVSAFAPIVAPSQAPWGQKAFSRYLGAEKSWRTHDAVALVEDGGELPGVLIDQGDADKFLDGQLKPALFTAACGRAGIDCVLRMQKGYDHSYYFIASFIDDHLHWHAQRLSSPDARLSSAG